MAGSSGRSESGTFLPGNKFSRGRPPSFTAALRRQADPDAIAARLIAIIHDPDESTGNVLKAIDLLSCRLDGKPIGRSLVMRATAAAILPAGFFELAPAARLRVLDDVRQRALAGHTDDNVDTDEGDDNGDTEED